MKLGTRGGGGGIEVVLDGMLETIELELSVPRYNGAEQGFKYCGGSGDGAAADGTEGVWGITGGSGGGGKEGGGHDVSRPGKGGRLKLPGYSGVATFFCWGT